jgi:hypothetical protein
VTMQPFVIYEIEVAGLMDGAWQDWFESLHILTGFKDGQPVTRLIAQFRDQAGLIGLLRQLHGMGLELLSITRTGEPAVRVSE